jgi:ubiquinone biosynthesis protein
VITRLRNAYHFIGVLGVIVHFRLDQCMMPAYLAPSTYWPFSRRLARLNRGQRLAKAFERLGPCYIKLGQLLSLRGDLLPTDIITGLSVLQDEVMPFDAEIAKRIIAASLNCHFDDVFKTFDAKPLGSASVAQVHAATLQDDSSVVIKVIRPEVKKNIKKDIALFMMLAGIMRFLFPWARVLRPESLIEEFSHHIHLELNLMVEAGNASLLRRNTKQMRDVLYVPEVYWAYTSNQVMVMERISGIKIDRIDELKKNKVNLQYLAESGVKLFFTQVFQDRFFHADMHPGNLFVTAKDTEKPIYQVVDFGIMGSLSPTDQRYLAENMLAFFEADYQRVALLHVQSGWVGADVRIDQFEAAIRSVCEPMFARPIKDISFGRLLLQLFRTAHAFSMEVQPQLMLLQKTLFTVESLGRMLYPDLDLWSTAKPFLEDWLKDQMGMKAFVRKSKQYFPYWLEKMPDMPEQIYNCLTSISAQNRQITPVVSPQYKPTVSWFKLGLSVIAGAVLMWGYLALDF